MHKIHFTSITSAPGGADAWVKAILLNQGHRVRALYGENWLKASAHIEAPMILFVGEADLPEARIVATLDRLKYPAMGGSMGARRVATWRWRSVAVSVCAGLARPRI